MDLISIILEFLLIPLFWVCLVIGGVLGLGLSYILFGEPNTHYIAYGLVIGGVLGLIISLDRKPKD